MRIGIDARLIAETGVGRYIRNLIEELEILDSSTEYVVFLRKKNFNTFKLPNTRWKKVEADVRWHTIAEQITMPRLFAQAKLDVVHIPYHNPPIFYSGPMIVTIHDLIILHFNTGNATTLPWPLYQLKRLGYWLELWIGLRRAKKIIAVSETTKQEIIDHFHIQEEKIRVTYEGVDKKFEPGISKRIIKDPYYLYVGNAYPHKNLKMMISACAKKKLVLVGADDMFYRRLRSETVGDNIIFFGSANDMELSHLYSNAEALIFPSLMEGFGLPALEALSFGCPVLVSDIPVFHEILGDNATYFDPLNSDDLRYKLSHVKKISINKNFLDKFSWQKMAAKTLEIYMKSVVQ